MVGWDAAAAAPDDGVIVLSTFSDDGDSMKLKTLVLGLVAVFLVGCASAPQQSLDKHAARVKKVSVVSLIGDQFLRIYVGFTVFGNERHTKDISNWRLDEAYEKQVSDALGEFPGFVAVARKVDTSTFPKGESAPGSFSSWADFVPALKMQCSTTGVDDVLLLVKSNRLFQNKDPAVVLFAQRMDEEDLTIYATMARFDCADGRVVASHALVAGPDPFFGDPKYPRIPLPDNWPVYGKWDQETYDEAHVQLIKLPMKAWHYTLEQVLTSD